MSSNCSRLLILLSLSLGLLPNIPNLTHVAVVFEPSVDSGRTDAQLGSRSVLAVLIDQRRDNFVQIAMNLLHVFDTMHGHFQPHSHRLGIYLLYDTKTVSHFRMIVNSLWNGVWLQYELDRYREGVVVIKGQRVKELREAAGLSVDELAKRLQMGKAQLLRYEQETADPSLSTLVRLAEIFSTSTDYLLGLTDNSRTSNERDEVNPTYILEPAPSSPLSIKIELTKLLKVFPPERVATFIKLLGIPVQLDQETLRRLKGDD